MLRVRAAHQAASAMGRLLKEASYTDVLTFCFQSEERFTSRLANCVALYFSMVDASKRTYADHSAESHDSSRIRKHACQAVKQHSILPGQEYSMPGTPSAAY